MMDWTCEFDNITWLNADLARPTHEGVYLVTTKDADGARRIETLKYSGKWPFGVSVIAWAKVAPCGDYS